MSFKKEKINAQLLFIIGFSVTALVLYLFKFNFLSPFIEVHHSFILNVIFINLTFFGSGIFCTGLILYLFYKKKYTLAQLLVAGSFLSAIIIQSIKNYLHNDGVQIFFENEQYLFNSQNTTTGFLSSHTAIAFTLSTILSLYFNNRIKAIFFFITAGIVAYTRIYLANHTIPDLFAGAFLGLASGSVIYYLFLNYLPIKKPRFTLTGKFITPRVQ